MTRVAIIAGTRTPFVKAGGVFSKYSFLDLAIHSVESLVKKNNIKPEDIDELIYSTVLLDPRYPNAARELVLRSELSNNLSAHFISNNCISGLVAANMIREGILSGRITSGIAGGSESMSKPTLTFSRKAEEFFIRLFSTRKTGDKLKQLLKFKPSFLMPNPPSPKEPSTGLTMGQHCEITTKEFDIKRECQDQLALNSHLNAAKAEGFLSEEISELNGINKDNIVRGDTSLEKLSKLRTVFDRSEKGTLTAGNSSSLTDGASAVFLMEEEKAKSLNYNILGYIEDVEFAAINPDDGLLMAPGLSLPKLMHKNSLTVDDIDQFEIHEAFAAQVLANMEVWENGWDKYPELKPIGKVPVEKININGSSIAIGHPFAATGGRLILSLVNSLNRNNFKKGVISVCAAGAMGCAMLISND